MKKITAIFLSALMIFSMFIFTVGAEDEKTGSFKALSFNVAGLPDVSSLSGEVTAESIAKLIDNKTMSNQRVIGKFVNSSDYDVFATQEDFFYHDILAKYLTDFNYSTQWQGGIPWGDGTTVFTKNMKLTGETHTKWDMLSGDGSAQDGADVYSRKGITYVCIEIAEGVNIDFYDIHADAFGDEGSVKARKDNFRQICDMIAQKDTGRAVIITGDFNISGHHSYEESGKYFTERFIEQEGFKDAWTELYNDGDYYDFSKFISTLGASYESYWGHWDSVEKFLYRDGDDVKLTCDSFNYINDITDEEGNNVSDHAAIEATFTYSATGVGSAEKESKIETQKESLFRKLFSFIIAFLTGIFNIKNILEFQGLV